MGAVETRYNRIAIPVDFMWARLKDSRGIPFTDAVESVNVKINEGIFTPKVGYRLVDKSRFKTDALIGLRYWHLGTTLTLQPQIGNGFYGAANWVDAVGGRQIPGVSHAENHTDDRGRRRRRWLKAGLSGGGTPRLQAEESDAPGWMALPGDSQKAYGRGFR
jgi:hypothetical protein